MEQIKPTNYPFARLDELVEINFNPYRRSYVPPATVDLTTLSAELERVFVILKCHTFALFTPNQIAPVVNAYLEAIDNLQNQARENLVAYGDDQQLSEAGELILMGLDDLQRRIQKRYARYLLQQRNRSVASIGSGSPLYKVLIKLSVDQIAVILKAADDTKLLIAKSLSAIFRSIMPFVSTEQKKDVSWKSARSSTYKFEEHDKIVAIQTLEKLISQIKRL
jgi:hypothetical protein